MKLTESFVRRRPLYRGRAVNFFVDTVRLPNGALAKREYLDHPGAAAVVPFLGDGRIVLVRQYRHPVGRVTYEIPAGKLDPGEPVRDCLRRELAEETGYAAGGFKPLLAYWPTPAFSNELLHIYTAENLRPGRRHPEQDEFLQTALVPFRRALEWVFQGRIRDSKTVIALLACRALKLY